MQSLGDLTIVCSNDRKVHLDIIKYSKGKWRLVREDFQSRDKIVLVFSNILKE